MPFDPTLPRSHARIVSAELRSQFTGLKELIDTTPAGPPGPKGDQGDPGDAGPKGDKGDAGDKGDLGDASGPALHPCVSHNSELGVAHASHLWP